MKNLITFLLVFCSMLSLAQYGNDYFRIGDVRYSWSTQKGSYDTVVFEVKPKGLYTEIGIYMDISTKGTSYTADDSLEIQMSFQLPDKADVTDMWLWINDEIVKADVYDKWTASQIYEDIVARRVDPAILYKYKYEYWYYDGYYSNGAIDMYMLRVFPLMTNLPRKLKFTYLIPTEDINTLRPAVDLPVNLLGLSNQKIQKFKVRFFADQYQNDPFIPGYPSQVFKKVNDPQYGEYLETDLSNIDYNSSLSLSFKNQYKDKQFTGTYMNPKGEDYYVMNLNPNKIFDLNKVKKGLFLFDFVKNNCSTLNAEQMLSNLKEKLHSNFTPADSFNIMISGMITQILSDKWIPADSLSIENTINSISKNDFNSYSGLPTLLIDGIKFIKENNDGAIILITSSNSNGSLQQANDLIQDYLSNMGPEKIPIHILDLDNIDTWEEHQYIGSRTYYGNEYLYINLSMETIGEYYSLKQTSFNVMLSSTFQKLSGFFSSFDLYVGMENGYTYANFDLSENMGQVYLDEPIQKVGKFTGNGRFKAMISAQMSTGEFYHTEFFIEQSEVIPMDSIARTIWATRMLRVMETYNQTNSTIVEIIEMSKRERVLTEYTAFLALEPGEGQLADDGQESVDNVSIEQAKPDELKSNLSIYPNPASNSTVMTYTIQKRSSVKIIIYDIYGKIIKIIDEGTKDTGTYTLTFDASTLSAGTYICKVSLDNMVTKPVKLSVVH